MRTTREAFPVAEKVGDQPTMDLLTQRMQIHEKNAWMLRTLLEWSGKRLLDTPTPNPSTT